MPLSKAEYADRGMWGVAYVEAVMADDEQMKQEILKTAGIPDLIVGLVVYASLLRDDIAEAHRIPREMVDVVYRRAFVEAQT